MKKNYLLLIVILLFTITTNAQHGFVFDYIGGGQLNTIDLSNATKTFVGNTMNNFGAGDFGPNDELFAINSGTNELYQIDTINGTPTFIGSIPPPSNHLWTGMAFDEASQLMYAMSSEGTSSGVSSLFIIDLSDASTTLVGSTSDANAIGCIAIDGTGQMYAMQMSALADLYMIDKTNCTATYVGEIGQGAAGMGHGMDWCNANQTMYLTTYNSINFENTLRTVNLTTGATTQVGGLLGMWTGVIAIPGLEPLSANFTSDITEVCAGSQVTYTDQSTGDVTSWSWTFEGGTPATSSDQNPVVTYNSVGTFDVTLEVGDGTGTSTTTVTDMILVSDIPAQPDEPSGETEPCGGDEITYTTNAVADAVTYNWLVTPSDAGTIVANGVAAVLTSSSTWTGSYTISVQAQNDCGTSTWSSELSCNLNFAPATFFISAGGSYCEGGDGIEITLDGSELDVDYELYYEGTGTGNIIAGTGSPLSFGFQDQEGLYQIWGMSTSCETLMFGEAYITIDYLPSQAAMPSGNDNVCAGSVEPYQTNTISGAMDIVWAIDPSDAGTIIGAGENIDVEWSTDYTGVANITVYGTNDCGDGIISDALEVTINEIPSPEVSGDTEVCVDEEYIYSTNENIGNTYIWTVEGGDITSGAGTFEIIVRWNSVGAGTISVVETNSATCDGESEVLNVVVDECTLINDFQAEKLRVYPNPATKWLTLDMSAASSVVTIYDLRGNVVLTEERSEAKVDVSKLPTGMYLIKVTNQRGDVFHSRFEKVE